MSTKKILNCLVLMVAIALGLGVPASASYIIPDGSITTAKMASTAVTAAKIANATITGTQVASNINLPGSAVEENGKNVVVSTTNATNSLSVIRGTVSNNGTIISGEGFTASKDLVNGTTTITFNTAFSDAPTVTGTVYSTAGFALNTTLTMSPPATSGAFFWANSGSSGSAANVGISFIAIGLRP